MNIKFINTTDNNNLASERILFEVTDDELLGTYLIAKSSKLDEKKVSSKLQYTYWFPDRDVKKGDQIVLYTKIGINTQRKSIDGASTIHFFYWGLSNPLWINKGDVIVISKLQNWDFKEPTK